MDCNWWTRVRQLLLVICGVGLVVGGGVHDLGEPWFRDSFRGFPEKELQDEHVFGMMMV